MVRKVTVGMIPSPDLPASIARNVAKQLPEALEKYVDVDVLWKVDLDIDPLTGAAEYIDEIVEKATYLKKENKWDYVICLTDLPSFEQKRVVTADVRFKNSVAFISMPAFGAFPLKNRIKKALLFLIDEMYSFDEQVTGTGLHGSRQEKEEEKKQSSLSNLKWRFLFSKIARIHIGVEEQTGARFILQSRVIGWMRVLSGMTFANRPWTALVSFKKIITLAFATGAYISIFSTPWELSVAYTPMRFVVLMLSSIASMVVWIIYAHNLWEKPTKKGGVMLRKLYNVTTIFTLFIIAVMNYFLLFLLFVLAIAIFVPPSLFDAWTDVQGEPTFYEYFQLAWLITSLGTLAGAIGTTGEQESKIRHITYSYRQRNRYYEIEQNNHKMNSSHTQTNKQVKVKEEGR